jgi:4-oxalocrotonate tautomerase family enzyme
LPVVTVQLWEGRSQEQKRSLVAAITRAMVDLADAEPTGLHVVLQEISPQNWGRAGVLGSDRREESRLPQPRVIGLSHFLLQVSDLSKAERFYRDALGFSVRKRETLPDGRDLLVFDQGMGLTVRGPAPPGPIEHVAFQTRAVTAFVKRIDAAGGEILSGPQPGAYGISLYFTDPDGNKLELHGD